MARSIADVPQYKAFSTQPNLCELPFRLTFTGGTVSASQLPPGMTFSSKTGTGIYRFVVPMTAATKYWATCRNTANTIVTFPSADSLVPTGFLDIQFGTTAATTATDPGDGVIATGTYFAGWGR
jgi:hypothetical protein